MAVSDESGMGSYHGKTGFDTFTHYKMHCRQENVDRSAYEISSISKVEEAVASHIFEIILPIQSLTFFGDVLLFIKSVNQ